MGALKRFHGILLADWRERTRSTRFWVVLFALACVSWLCFPPIEAHYLTVSIGANLRAEYSSAWIGMTVGLLGSTMMTLFGFYLVRGTLVRDFDTRVWQLLVATPMTRAGYLLAKWTSHLLVLCVIMMVGVLVGLIAQMWRAEDTTLNLVEVIKPVLLISLPALAVTSMLAVLFDLVPWLRRTAGNILYFFVWVAIMAVTNTGEGQPIEHGWISDPNGIGIAWHSLKIMLPAGTDGMEINGLSIGGVMFQGNPTLLHWTHWTVPLSEMAGRLFWVAISMAAVVAMVPALDWAAARISSPSTNAANNPGRRLLWLNRMLRPLEGFPAGLLFAAELKLMLRPRRFWWWLALLALAVVQLVGSLQALAIACMGTWIVSTDLFARAVLRERENGTGALVFSAAGAQQRMLAIRTSVALSLAVIPVLPALIRLSVSAPTMALALLMTATSVALAGLAIGVVCRNPRPFELLLVALAYAGAQGEPLLNVATDPSFSVTAHAIVVPITAILLIVLWPLHAGTPVQSGGWQRFLSARAG
jgi:phage-related holin